MFKRYAAVIACTLCICATAGPAGAADLSAAKSALKERVDVILSILRDPAYENLTPEKDKEQRAKLTAEVNKVFDWQELSMRAVGMYWKKFSGQEKKDFSEAFSGLLEATYLNQIRGNADGQVKYVGEREGKKGRVEVQTMVISAGKEIPIDYRMHQSEGKWMVYDVLAEGVSLVQNYRSQLKDMLISNSPAQVIEKVRQKAAKLQET